MQGFVISDWQGIDRITTPAHANYSYSVYAGITAGIDMVCSKSQPLSHLVIEFPLTSSVSSMIMQIMVPYNYTEFIDILTYQVKNNLIPMSRIDDAVRRILRVKFTMGLFENPMADDSLVDQLGSQVRWLNRKIFSSFEE